MRRLVIVAGFIALLVVPAASAGGWATVIMAPPPAGLEADETWTANITVLRHGVTPTDGAAPSVTIKGEEGSQTFQATPTGATGAYVAHVVFPAAGSWEYQVSDGLAATGYGVSQTHTYSLVDIAPGTGGGGWGVPVWPFALAAIALLAVGAMALARQRGSRPATQS
jgi:hypothetical protein